jgi:glycosyltransferase involved in cell wall biosynthesis
MKKKKVHIVGTHGVPAKYGGFETLADFLCQQLNSEYELTVYCNAYKYPEKAKEYFGAKLIYLKLDASGFKGIIYDFITYIYALFKADVILYLSPVGSGFMTPLKYLKGKRVIVNHGGLNEWEREKLSWFQKKWAKFNHSIAARFADVNIADNELYKKSLKENFNADSVVIRYGGDHVQKISKDDDLLSTKYPFVDGRYAVSVSRAQLDNNIHLVLEAFEHFNDYKIVLVSNWNVSTYGKELKEKYANHPNIILLDAIYDKRELDFIRGNAYVYIHSHSRCGTAPSLVEAMCLEQAIISYDVATNRETTQGQALFFTDSNSLVNVLKGLTAEKIEDNRLKMYSIASKSYTWKEIANQYENVIDRVLKV